jgi:hypothetical protein
MIEYQVYQQPKDTSAGKRVVRKKRQLCIDLPAGFFQTAYVNFNEAAEAFAMSLSDSRDRKFACQYFEYLQDIARGSQPSTRPNANGNPNSRLIVVELERLFNCHFFRPERLPSLAS